MRIYIRVADHVSTRFATNHSTPITGPITYQVQLAGQVGSTAVRCLIPVCLVVLEEVFLVLQSIGDGPLVLNITLTAVDNGNVTQAQRNNSSSENIHNISALVHQINLTQHTNSALTLGVHLTRQLQTIGVGQILVGRGDGQNDGVGLADVLENHIPNLALNILGLISDGHLGQTGQIDQGQGEDVGRVDAQVDRNRRDTGIAADLGLRLPDNLLTNLVEVEELLARDMQELAILIDIGLGVCRLDLVISVRLRRRGLVDQLQDKRSPSDNSGTTRQAK